MTRRFSGALWALTALSAALVLAIPESHAAQRALSSVLSALASPLAERNPATRIDSRPRHDNLGAGRSGDDRLGGSRYFRRQAPTYRRAFRQGDIGLSQPNRRGGYGEGRTYNRGTHGRPKGGYTPR